MSPRRISSKSASRSVCAPAKRGGTTGTRRLVLEIRAVERGKLHQLREVERALDPVDLGRSPRAEPFVSRSTICVRGRRAHLDADDVAEATLPELGLDGFEEVCRVVGDLEVGVARDAEDRPLDDGHARERAAAGSARSPARAGGTGRRRRARGNAASPSGILTRAKRSSPLSGSGTKTASDSERPEM